MSDIFESHSIAEAINQDFNKIFKSHEMISFEIGLQYKSAKTKSIDTDLMNMLLNKLKLYKDGWVMCNANKTAELFNKAKVLDECFELISEFNNHVNQIIISLKNDGKINPDQLNDLRELERHLKKLAP